MKKTLAIVLLLTALSQAQPAQPNRQGEYEWNTWDNAAIRTGRVDQGMMAGTLWRVIAPTQAMSEPRSDSRVVKTFQPGTILQADVGRGGSDEVLRNASDKKKNFWMRVRDENGRPLNCYVHANSAIIVPVTTSGSPGNGTNTSSSTDVAMSVNLPANGATVPKTFVLSGTASPGSKVETRGTLRSSTVTAANGEWKIPLNTSSLKPGTIINLDVQASLNGKLSRTVSVKYAAATTGAADTKEFRGSTLKGVPGVGMVALKQPLGQLLDEVIFNNADSEKKHNVNGKNTESGDLDGWGYRGAVDGWFGFTLRTNPGQPVDLVLTYNGDDENSNFEVLVNDKPIAGQALKKIEAGKFFDVRYRIQPSVIDGQGTMRVALKGLPPRRIAGGLFGAKTYTVVP